MSTKRQMIKAGPATAQTDAIGAARENLRTELRKGLRGLHWPGEVDRRADDLLAAIDGLITARLVGMTPRYIP
jgi:hypothetical protein